MFGSRILVLAAHPDDEVVACCASIGRAKAAGAEVFSLYLTHGCVAREVMWPWQSRNYQAHIDRRRAEGEKAAQYLGLKPLGWGARPARHLWRDLESVFNEIESAVLDHRIDQLWIPAYEGGNADHDALNAVGSLFREQLGVLEFAEYNYAGGKVHSQEFPYLNGSEKILTLSPVEQQKKRNALKIYASEKGNLDYVDTIRECWRPLAAYDYSHPPHEGALWYARFQWVPFRHPRVDFTKPEDVAEAIGEFL
jgi:LmbE family N-acetylglucosaminyl deacetylase